MNRALRAAAMGVLLLSPVVLSACSAGQETQTAGQERDQTGAQAQVGDISVRAAQLLSPRGGTYEQGDDADLQLAIVNGGDEADTLVSVEGEGFGSAEIENSDSGTGSGSSEIEIPARSAVLVDGESLTVTLTDLDEDLTPGLYVEVTLTFENAGEVTLPVTVANPEESDRGEAYDFHEEEEAATEG